MMLIYPILLTEFKQLSPFIGSSLDIKYVDWVDFKFMLFLRMRIAIPRITIEQLQKNLSEPKKSAKKVNITITSNYINSST